MVRSTNVIMKITIIITHATAQRNKEKISFSWKFFSWKKLKWGSPNEIIRLRYSDIIINILSYNIMNVN